MVMNKKLKLRKFVMPTVYGMLVIMFSVAVFMSFKSLTDVSDEPLEDINYVSENIISNEVPVVSTEKVIIKPFKNKDIKIGKYFYNYKDSSDSQRNSIIFYEDSYIQNSGVDYILDKVFDVIAIYDGVVEKVEDNDIVGNTVEIKHDNNLISVYQSLSDVKVKQGDVIKQGTVVGKSGMSKINNDLGNHLHFELYVNGEVVDPEVCYNKKANEL